MNTVPHDKSASSAAPDASSERSNEPAGGRPDADDPALQGEGNYTAARRHRQSAEDFVERGDVERAAREAAPDSAEEEADLKAAEQEGRSHAKR